MITKLNDTGIFVIPDTMLPGGEYVQVKRHKKKRINKKYLKKYGVRYQAPMKLCAFGGGIYCPESHLHTLQNKLNKDNKTQNVNKEEKLRVMDNLDISPC